MPSRNGFTTKVSSGGSGLGLTIVQRILSEIGASVDVQSRMGEGTVITIKIPVTRNPPEQTPGTSFVPKEENTSAMIYIVDDNPKYLKVSESMITHFGHRVESFNSGQELLIRIEEADADPAVVITDLSMPDMDGIMITRAIQSIKPDIPILCCTGFGSESMKREAKRAGVARFLHKPIDMDELEEILNSVIESKGPAVR